MMAEVSNDPFSDSPYLRELRDFVEAGLTNLGNSWTGHDSLVQAMRHALLGGGKRLRPVLLLSAAECLGRPRAQALNLALALELIHTYSLVHDDLPAMDNDLLRRGLPTVHAKFGHATGILAGDALLTEAFRVAAQSDLSAEAARDAVVALATAAGHLGMVSGQMRDILDPMQSVAEIERMHAEKTGALFQCACQLGAISAGAPSEVIGKFRELGSLIGAAFQILDDLLDFHANSNADEHERRVNLAFARGETFATNRLNALCDRISEIVSTLGPAGEHFDDFSRWMRHRMVDLHG